MTPVCPKCDCGLVVLRWHDLEIDVCHRCRGLWLDEGELEQLLQIGEGHADDRFLSELGLRVAESRQTHELCPRCDRHLEQVRLENLTVERCADHHGIWFDEGELQQLLALVPLEPGARRTIDYLNEILVKQSPSPNGDLSHP